MRPGSAVYHGNLGVALQAVGKLDAARANLERAVKLDPQQVDALFNLGVTLQTLGLLDEAVGLRIPIVWPWPIGNAVSSYARVANASSTNKCRGTLRICSSTCGFVIP